MKIPFIGGQSKRRSVNQSAQQTVNLYLEIDSAEKDTNAALYMVPGKRLFASVGSGPIRGMLAWKGWVIVVSGAEVYRMESDGTSTLLGSVHASVGMVSMAAGSSAVVIVDNGPAWSTDGVTLSAINDADYLGSNTVTYQDGYFVFHQPETRTLFITSGLDALTVDGLDFAQAKSGVDPIVAVISDHQEVWILCQSRAEIWYDSGASDFPFARRDGAMLEAGCIAPMSVVKIDNSIMWLGRTRDGGGVVYRAGQYTPAIISNRGIESEIAGYDLESATAFAYQQNGHVFYCLSFDEKTYVYDASIADPDIAWHVRSTYNRGRDRASCHAYAFGVNLVGDNAGNQVMVLDLETYDDLGEPIVWERTGQRIISDSKRVLFRQFVANIERGVGIESGQGIAPKMYLDWSDDGGHTWSMKRELSMGAMGVRYGQIAATRLGQSRDRVFRLSGSDPVKTVILGAYVEAQTAAH